MDTTPSNSYSPIELARLINAALLRDDSPAPGKIANRIYNNIMTGQGAFARVSRMLETEAMHLISRELPSSMLGTSARHSNELPAWLHPAVHAKIESEYKNYIQSDSVRNEVKDIYSELCNSIERAGWSFGIVNLAPALEIFRDKVRKQVSVYNRSIALIGPLVDLEPLYKAASRTVGNDTEQGVGYTCVQSFYTALCDNTRSCCTEIAATFSRDILNALAEWPRLQAIIDSNKTLHKRCMDIAAKCSDEPKCRVFSDPDRSDPMDLVNI